MNVLVVGGSGGIGLAVVQQLLAQFPLMTVYGTYLSSTPSFSHERLTWHHMDGSDETSVEALSKNIPKLDWLINCAGILHTPGKGPEKSVSLLQADFFLHNIMNNTLPTLLLARYFTPILKGSPSPKFAVVSAKVGSISDNRLGGWYSYRMSKAALNMFIKTLSIEWQRAVKKGIVLALHPGTTDTALSEPFQSNVQLGKLFSPKKVASALIELIDSATPDDSGKFIDYNGVELPW